MSYSQRLYVLPVNIAIILPPSRKLFTQLHPCKCSFLPLFLSPSCFLHTAILTQGKDCPARQNPIFANPLQILRSAYLARKSLLLKQKYFNEKIEIRERCKGVHCVDLGESFPTSIYLQNLASIQPRTSLFNFFNFSPALVI